MTASRSRGRPARRDRATTGVADRRLIDAGDLVRVLGELGLTRNEARVYLALLSAPALTAAETAAAAAVPRPKVYEALESLESRGFCRSAVGRVRRYGATAPDVALRNWVTHRDHERAMVSEREHSHVETLVRVLPRPHEPASVEIPEFIKGVSGRLPTTEALEDLISRATSSLDEMLQPPFLQPRSRWNVREVEALGRGVTVRVIYTPDALEDRRRYADLLDHGGEVRVLERLPMKLLVRDGEDALISLRDATTGVQSVTSARVQHPDLVAPLASLFAQTWSTARALRT